MKLFRKSNALDTILAFGMLLVGIIVMVFIGMSIVSTPYFGEYTNGEAILISILAFSGIPLGMWILKKLVK